MRVSVALCTYNGGRYLAAQLASLAAQTRRPDELVVCDDASTDDTAAILDRFAAAAPFPVRVHRNPTRLGTTPNFDRALGLCTGDVILLCDQDDVWHAEKVDRFAGVFAAEPGVGLVASDLELIDAAGEPLGRRVWADLGVTPATIAALEAGAGPRLWMQANTITGAAAAVRASLFDVIRPIPPGWVHDAWIAFVAAAVSGVRLLPEPLTFYRSHAGQQIGSAPRTLRRQLRAARRWTAATFAESAACFAAAEERLRQFPDRLRDPALLPLLRDRIAFARARQRMREGHRLARLRPALRALRAGHYHRFGRGWKGFAADVVL